MRQITVALAALSLSLFATMTWYTWTVLKPFAQGLPPFDMRVLGYSEAATRQYLEAMESPARAFYLLEMRMLDTLFPLALAGFCGTVILLLTRGWHAWSRLMLLLPVAGYAVMDLAENSLTRALVRAGAERFDVTLAMRASQFTISKFVLLLASVLLILWLWRRARA